MARPPFYTPELNEEIRRRIADLIGDGMRKQAAYAIVASEIGTSTAALQVHLSRLRNGRIESRNKALLSPSEAPPEADPDPVAVRRLKDENARLRASVKELEQRAVAAEDIRSGVLQLTETPLRPRLVIPRPGTGTGGGRMVVLHLTDVHYGEVVRLDEMDGANSYNEEIANRRLARYFDTVGNLMTKHWTGDPPERIKLLLGGDLISGSIHAELTESNWAAVPETVKKVAERIAGGIMLLRDRVGCPIDVYSVPGNHGRQTFKPVSKGRAATSWDMLVTDFIEAAIRGVGLEDVTFYNTRSPDAYFSTYGFHWLLNHGDTTGSRGGQGFIGAAATIVRGHRKLMDTAWRAGRPVHYVVTGHLHTTLRTPFGFSGGSLVGYSEYSRDGRFDPEPARQNMIVVHEAKGVISFNEIYVGSPEEGSHYHGPASIIRPSMEAA